jgi:HPt (histidine-containing phosphotransfer) domain-containing protein
MNPDFLRALEVQRARYREALPGRIAAIERLWDEVCGGAGQGALAGLVLEVHGLAGSGAVFGFEALGTEAKSLERELLLPGAASTDRKSAIAASIAVLRRSMERPDRPA